MHGLAFAATAAMVSGNVRPDRTSTRFAPVKSPSSPPDPHDKRASRESRSAAFSMIAMQLSVKTRRFKCRPPVPDATCRGGSFAQTPPYLRGVCARRAPASQFMGAKCPKLMAISYHTAPPLSSTNIFPSPRAALPDTKSSHTNRPFVSYTLSALKTVESSFSQIVIFIYVVFAHMAYRRIRFCAICRSFSPRKMSFFFDCKLYLLCKSSFLLLS